MKFSLPSKNITYLFILFIYNTTFCQLDNDMTKTMFTYQDIDSLQTVYLQLMKEQSSNPIVIFTKWYIGSIVETTDEKATYKNHFNMYVIWKDKERQSKFLHLFNLRKDEVERLKFNKIERFLKSKFNSMKMENLSPRLDKIDFGAEIIEIESPFIPHQLEYQVTVFYRKELLKFRYRPSWKANLDNLDTEQYQFIELLDRVATKIDRKKH